MRSVSCDARYLMLYLLTSPHRNMLGFYFLPLPYACFDLGWDEHRLRQGLHELMQTGRIKYDERAHVVLVQNYIKHNPFENPNQVKGAVDRLEVIPHTPLLQELLTVVEALDEPLAKPLVEGLKERLHKPLLKGCGTLSEPFRNPSETLSKPVTVTVTVTEEERTCASDDAREHSEATEQPLENGRAASHDSEVLPADEPQATTPAKGKSPAQQQQFAQFWEAYPKKRSKGEAEKAWAKLKPDKALLERILNSLERD